MGDDAGPIEVPDFKMKQLSRFRITSQPFEHVSGPSSLLAACPVFGLLFVGIPGKVLVAKVADLIEIDANHIKKSQEISNFPCKEILLPSTPSFVAVSSDGLTLLVCLQKSNCPVAWLYDVRGFSRQGGSWSPFQEVRLSSNEGTTVHDCSWNPTVPGMVAISLSDGSLLSVEVNESQFTLNSLPADTGAQAISWSPKGKQLVVARPGKLVQYKPDLKEAKTIPYAPGDVGMGRPAVCGLHWLSNVQFLAAFVDQDDPTAQPHLFIVNSHKTGPPTFVDYDDVCYGNPSGGRTNRYQMVAISAWNVAIVSSANAMEAAVLGQSRDGPQNAEHPNWRQWMPEGTDRAELPLDSSSEETRPMGMALDTTTQRPIPWADNQSLPAMPVLFLLSTDGLLCPFHVLNLLDGGKPVPIPNSAPQALSAAGERPAMKSAASAAPPLAASTPLGKSSIPRTNLGDRFAAVSGPISDVSALSAPPPPKPAVQVQPTQPPPAYVQPAQKVQPALQPKAEEVQSGMGAAAVILRDEVAKFVSDLQDFKARSASMRLMSSTEADKERLLKTTGELSAFGSELVETTKTQDEEIRSLYTELMDVGALLEDARLRHARRRNPRYGHLAKLRPLDPASRRRMDGIERLHVHIEQQLEEAARTLESMGRSIKETSAGRAGRKAMEIPVTQVICEAIKNNARVIQQLEGRLERIKAQGREQQLKLAGAAFEALRLKDSDVETPSRGQPWDSELALLADSLLASRIGKPNEAPVPVEVSSPSRCQSVVPQVSPEKQALLRNVLSQRPVARIRAVRPETVSESRLLSNLNSLMHPEEKKSSPASTAPPASHPPRSKTGLLSSSSTAQQPVIEDISPPSTPIRNDLTQKAQTISGQTMISSLALIPRSTPVGSAQPPPPAYSTAAGSPALKPAVPVDVVKPLPPPAYTPPTATPLGVKPVPAASTTPAKSGAESGLTDGKGGSSLFGGKSFLTSAFSSAGSSGATPPMFGSKGLPSGSAAFAPVSSASPATTPSSSSTLTPSPLAPPIPPPTIPAATPKLPPVVPAAAAVSSAASPTSSLTASASAPSLLAAGSTLHKSGSFFGSLSMAAALSTATPTAPTVVSTPASTTPAANTPVAAPAPAQVASTSAPPAATTASTPKSTFGFATSAAPASPASFSFSLPKTQAPTTTAPTVTTTSAPFTFSLSGGGPGAVPAPATSSVATTTAPAPAAPTTSAPFTFSLSGMAAGASAAPASSSTGAIAPLFTSLNATAKPPSVFGAVPTSSATPGGSIFGQQPTTAVAPAPFGQAATPTSPTAALASLFGPTKAETVAPPTVSTPASAPLFGASSGAAPAPLFGRPAAATTTAATTTAAPPLFGAQPTSGSVFGQSVFGQPQSAGHSAAPSSTPAPVFGQSAFGAPSATSVFGQPSLMGASGPSAFGSAKPVFGGSAFGQPGASGASSQPSSSSGGFGSGPVFGGMGLGGAPSAANANRNVFGGGAVFGVASPAATPSAGSSLFGGAGGSTFGSPAAGGSSGASAFGSPAPNAGGGFGSSGAFGQSQPAFGGAPTFGGSPLFGGKPTFGSPTVAPAALSPPKAEASAGFGAFAAAGSGPSFAALASNSQPAFGGAAFPQSPPPAFGSGSSFTSWR